MLTFDNVLLTAKELVDDLDDALVPVELDRYTQICRKVFASEGEEASARFLMELDEIDFVFREFAYYGAVKAFVEVFGECPPLLVGLVKSCLSRLTIDTEDAKYFLDRAISIDPEDYWVLWEVLMEGEPCIWTEEMYERVGMGPRPWTWKQEARLLDKILDIKPKDELALLIKETIERERKSIHRVGDDFWNREVTTRFEWGPLPLKEVVPECIEWKKRHKKNK